MARRSKSRADIYARGIDQSWHKHRKCQLCGTKICVNNYPDRRSRVPKYKGVIVCPWCVHDRKGKEYIRLYQFVQRVQIFGCFKIRFRRLMKADIGHPCGKCLGCRAFRLLEGCDANIPPLP